MKGLRVGVSSSGQVKLDDIMAGGVRGAPDIDAFATADARQAAVMLWNYNDAEKPAPSEPASVTVAGLPKSASRVRLTHYRIDDAHSNAYTVWKAMGSPQNPNAAQIAELKSKDGLQLLESPRWAVVQNGAVTVSTDMPHHAISLLQLDW
jgi:xylan 1,4-beta-xylosidase